MLKGEGGDTAAERFGLRLRARRDELNLTLAQLAERTGIDAADLSRYENGKREPGIEIVRRLATALEVTSGDLLC